MEARRRHPVMEGEETWLRRYNCEPVFSSRRPNADKVCFADPELREEGFKFSRVFPTHASKIVRSGREPVEGSPSLPMWSSHTKHAHAITSTCRLKISFRKMQSGKAISYLGTGFLISQDIILSAGHLFSQDEEDEDVTLIDALGCHGSYVSMSCFVDDVCFSLATIAPPTNWPSDLLMCGLKGLTNEGSDLAFARAEGDMCAAFLLPISPSFLHRRGEKVPVFCLSYPAIDAFVNQAEKELHVLSETDTWAGYESMIAAELKAEILKVAADGSALTKEDQDKIKLEIKRRFFEEMKATFDGLHTGMLTCAVGVLIYDPANPFSIGTTCSLLNGSSGGPICTPWYPAYFIAVHSGGSDADNLNFATSTDNPKFVSEYMELVLPTLPPPTDSAWTGLDLMPFFDWLSRHKEFAILPHTASTSLWFEEASKHCGPPVSLKRKRSS